MKMKAFRYQCGDAGITWGVINLKEKAEKLSSSVANSLKNYSITYKK